MAACVVASLVVWSIVFLINAHNNRAITTTESAAAAAAVQQQTTTRSSSFEQKKIKHGGQLGNATAVQLQHRHSSKQQGVAKNLTPKLATTTRGTEKEGTPIMTQKEEQTSAAAAAAATTTTFYATGDAPYTRIQALKLGVQMAAVPADAEFVVHIGDLRRASPRISCEQPQYQAAAAILRLSHAAAPVFVIIGDNDWTDCPNQAQGLQLWQDEFVAFDSKYWNHSFAIQRQPGRPYNFCFEHKGTLFVGLNIVGGKIHDAEEWSTRLADQADWTIALIRNYHHQQRLQLKVGRVVLFGHADPNKSHRPFFKPLRAFLKDELHSKVPMLYLSGDTHAWLYQPNFYKEPSLLRITVTGLAVDPLLQVVVTADGQYADPQAAFAINRRLDNNDADEE